MHVVSNTGKILFSGSRHDCKQFVRKNNVKQYKLKERFAEKVIVVEEPVIEEVEEKVKEPEAFFNQVFTTSE